MRIDRANYEVFALDYLEGNLNALQTEAFRMFLEQNPDLKDEVFSIVGIEVSANLISFGQNDFLKKTHTDLLHTIPREDFECIAQLEKDLEPVDSNALLKKMSADPELRYLFNQYSLIKLSPSAEHFDQKKLLKKPGFKILIPVWIRYTAAAFILLALVLRIFLVGESRQTVAHIRDPIASGDDKNPSVPTVITEIKPREETGEVRPLLAVQDANATNNYLKLQTVEKPLNDTEEKIASEVSRELIILPEILSTQANLLPLSNPDAGLKPPVIYIPEFLTEDDLATLESYTIKDFKIKLLNSRNSGESYTPLLIAIAKAGVNGINKLTGSHLQLNSSTNRNGKLTSLAFVSDGLKFSTQLDND